MKRRGFLGLLGLAPAVPLIAKELSRSAEPVLSTPAPPAPVVSDVWQLQPLDADKMPWQGMSPLTASYRDCTDELSFPVLQPPTEDTRLIELTVTFPIKHGLPMPRYARVHFMGKPVLTMPTQLWGETFGGTVTIIQNIQLN